MTKLLTSLRVRMSADKGATMVEYGIMVALIAVIVMVAVGPLGTTIAGVFNNIAGQLAPMV